MDSIYFTDPLGLLIELASYRFEPPFGYTHSDVLLEAHRLRVERGDYNIDRGAPGRRDRADGAALARRRCPTTDPPGTRTDHPLDHPTGGPMSDITLNILKPSVNNLTVRIFVRAAGLDFEEVDVWGKTGEPEFLAKDPAHLTPMIEDSGLDARIALGELRDHAVPLQHARARPVLSGRPGQAGDGRQRDVLPDRHAVSAARAGDVSDALLPPVRGRGGDVRGGRRDEGDGPAGRGRRDRRAARRLPRVLPGRQAVHRRRVAVDRRHPLGGERSSSCARSTTRSRRGPRST